MFIEQQNKKIKIKNKIYKNMQELEEEEKIEN